MKIIKKKIDTYLQRRKKFYFECRLWNFCATLSLSLSLSNCGLNLQKLTGGLKIIDEKQIIGRNERKTFSKFEKKKEERLYFVACAIYERLFPNCLKINALLTWLTSFLKKKKESTKKSSNYCKMKLKL